MSTNLIESVQIRLKLGRNWDSASANSLMLMRKLNSLMLLDDDGDDTHSNAHNQYDDVYDEAAFDVDDNDDVGCIPGTCWAQ